MLFRSTAGNSSCGVLRGIYRLLDAEPNVESVQIDQNHNYSKESREAVYTFFGARLLGGNGPVAEQRFRVEQVQDLLARFGKELPADAVPASQLGVWVHAIRTLAAEGVRG